MADAARYALHRPQHLAALERGDAKIDSRFAENTLQVPAGATLIRAGTDHEFVYRVRKGWAGRSRSLRDARSQFILIFLPGDLFAVKSMFMLQHPDDVTAISDLTVDRMPYEDLHSDYVSDSDVATRCIWQVMEEERRLHSWVVGLGQGSAEERLARLLIDFRGRLIVAKALAKDSLSYTMPLTHVQMADHLGITPVHVNRVLKSLRERAIVSIQNHVVTVDDLNGLVRIGAALLDTFENSSAAYVGDQLVGRSHLL